MQIKKALFQTKLYQYFINNIERKRKFDSFFRDFESFLRLTDDDRFYIDWNNRFPCLEENTKTTNFDFHYIYHPAWASRIISEYTPKIHYDISSTLSFSTIISAFIPVRFFDYRPAPITLSNLSSEHIDLLKLPFKTNSVLSLSCMHVIEHIGLGRYGDQINPKGDIQAISELKRVLAPEGLLLIVVPVGKNAIVRFNAHRVYKFDQIMEAFDPLKLMNFTLITDIGKYIENATIDDVNQQEYGCGCWCFRK